MFVTSTDLTQVMATSQDWDELVWAWKGWREVSGKKMTSRFTEMFNLQNEAADINGKSFFIKKNDLIHCMV